MATCKDCLHIGICPNLNHETVADKCPDFKDRSRFVELPCKVRDDVWIIQWWNGFCVQTEKHPIQRTVLYFSIQRDGLYAHFYDGRISTEQFGKTVFLTRAEAEAELARRTANG